MVALATPDDVAARLGRTFTSDEEDRVSVLLDDASAAVRAYTGQQFTLVEDDEARLRARNGSVTLPQRPVTEVSAVANVDGGSVEFTWDAGSSVLLAGLDGLRSWEVEPYRHGRPVYVDVTYSHGYDEVPADIVLVVCEMVSRAFGRPSDATAVTQESIAGYSYSISGAAAQGPGGFTNTDRAILDRYRRPLGTIRVA